MIIFFDRMMIENLSNSHSGVHYYVHLLMWGLRNAWNHTDKIWWGLCWRGYSTCRL